MTERCLGIAVSGDKVVVVDAETPDKEGTTLIVHGDFTIPLQKGDRPSAYAIMSQRVSDYAREKGVERAIVKESAVNSMGGTKLAHLHSAELRGVVICALSAVCETSTISKSNISKNFGDRKADEYIGDAAFWAENFEGGLRAGSREAAFCILAGSK